MKYLVANITLIVALSFTTSCKSDVKSAVEGMWSIDTISYKGYDIKACLTLNVISFKDKADLPNTGYRCSEFITVFDRYGDWKISSNEYFPLSLKIDSKNQIFAGTHQIIFSRDLVNKLLKMEITSPNLYVVCRKGLFNYDANEAIIKRLIYLSNKH